MSSIHTGRCPRCLVRFWRVNAEPCNIMCLTCAGVVRHIGGGRYREMTRAEVSESRLLAETHPDKWASLKAEHDRVVEGMFG